uniref:Gamma-aminobutyric acid receptor alpha-like n=1 Tax=Diabrotica virgifera virgifera TaxID=50390 RepID=A0A6P7FGI4_DIAVI
MNLENFPMDIQKCPLTFGSFGYTKKDVLYRWNFARQVAIADDMKLSQFDLIGTPSGNNSFNPFNGDIRSGNNKNQNGNNKFAVVHYFTKYGSGECYFSFSSDSSSEDEDSNTSYVQPKASKSVAKSVHECSKPNPRFDEIIQLTDDLLPSTSTKPATKPPARRLSHQAPPTAKRRFSVASRRVSTQSSKGYRKKKRSPRFNSVSKIDRVSRILFPFLFIAINTFYWYSYL